MFFIELSIVGMLVVKGWGYDLFMVVWKDILMSVEWKNKWVKREERGVGCYVEW